MCFERGSSQWFPSSYIYPLVTTGVWALSSFFKFKKTRNKLLSQRRRILLYSYLHRVLRTCHNACQWLCKVYKIVLPLISHWIYPPTFPNFFHNNDATIIVAKKYAKLYYVIGSKYSDRFYKYLPWILKHKTADIAITWICIAVR